MKSLSILIPTLNEPRSIAYLQRLRLILDPQIERFKDQVEIRINDAGRSMLIGTKRNEMIRNCQSDYFCFIDCDDMVSDEYVYWIMDALQHDPDVVTFNGWMTTNSVSRVDFIIKLGENYEERGGKYYRWPNHLCVFKREKVSHIRFPEVKHGEDYRWSKEIHDKGLLKMECHIEKQLYHYDFITNK